MPDIPPLGIPDALETQVTELVIQNKLKDIELTEMRRLCRALLEERNTVVRQLDDILDWLSS